MQWISHHPSIFLLWYWFQGLFLELPACSSFHSPAWADFLQHFNLLVDIKSQGVVHADCPDSVVLWASPGPVQAFRSISCLSAPQRVQKLLEDFPDVFSSDGFTASKPCQPWSSSLCQTSEVGSGEVICCQGGVLHHGESWYHLTLDLHVVLSSPHGQEEGRRLEALRRLQETEQPHSFWQVPLTSHCWFHFLNS